MTEFFSTAIIATTVTGGLTVFGIATGLQPELIIAGMAGGFWAQTSQRELGIIARVSNAAIASMVAAYIAPVLSVVLSHFAAMATKSAVKLDAGALALVCAVGCGLLAYHAGPILIKLSSDWLSKLGAKNGS